MSGKKILTLWVATKSFSVSGSLTAFRRLLTPFILNTVLGLTFSRSGKFRKKFFVSQTIVGAFYSKKGNPDHPIEPDVIREQAFTML